MFFSRFFLSKFSVRRLCSGGSSNAASSNSSSATALYNRIKATGPLTVAEYMRECLLNPLSGYYMKQTVFGSKGDFITSPEISQVFGELMGVWVIADWMMQGRASPCHVIELGPGRGSMMKDMLRVFEQLGDILPSISIHLVEASPKLKASQLSLLTNSTGVAATDSSSVDEVTLANGVNVKWYSTLSEVPQGFGYYLAHEFFDALPVHQLISTGDNDQWREILIDIDSNSKSEKKLQFVISPQPTPASLSYSELLGGGVREGEVCPQGLQTMEDISNRIKLQGGGALIADYGGESIAGFTLRGYKGHSQCDVLTEPGHVDLTADVNFDHLKRIVARQGCVSHGPITQNEFLHKMGIRQRLEVLLSNTDSSMASGLINSYEWLTSPEKMGQRFKFFGVTANNNHIPTPF